MGTQERANSAGARTVKEISLKLSHALTLNQDGTISSWGGDAPITPSISNVAAISAGFE